MSEPAAETTPRKPRKRVAASRPAAATRTPDPPEPLRQTYSQPVTDSVSPLGALHREIARTEAAVEWLQAQISDLSADQLVRGTRSVRRVEDASGVKTITEAGNVRHELLQLFIDERHHLHALCRDALSMKQPERTTSGGWPSAGR